MIELRDQYVARFDGLDAVQRAEAHDGEFRPGEVERLGGGPTPAVFVSCMGIAPGELNGRVGGLVVPLRWVAFVLVRSEDSVREMRNSAGDVAALISLAIVSELYDDPFESAGGTSRIKAQNLFGTRLAREGFTLWAVSWQQSAVVPDSNLAASYDALRTIYTDFDLSPESGVDMSASETMKIDRDLTGEAHGEATAAGDLES